MSYTVKRLADLAGVSVRTLHYYDQIGLLKPDRIQGNGYRYYEEAELLKLQQILFFRELDFAIEDIKRILSAPDFDMCAALDGQKKLIGLKRKRLNKLIRTIDKTINKLTKKTIMEDKDLYGGFDKEEMKKLEKEAEERWGHTEAYRQSRERVKKMSKEEMMKIQEEGDVLMKELAKAMGKNPADETVQMLIDKHYNNLRHFYEPNLEMYRGLAEMYIQDQRFTAYFEKYAIGLARFMHDAMMIYCKSK